MLEAITRWNIALEWRAGGGAPVATAAAHSTHPGGFEHLFPPSFHLLDMAKDAAITRLPAALTFTGAGVVLIAFGVPLLRGRARPNSWYGCRTEKTLSNEKVWYAINRVTVRDLVSAGVAAITTSLALLAFGRGANPDHAVLALPFVLLLSVVLIAVGSYGSPKRM